MKLFFIVAVVVLAVPLVVLWSRYIALRREAYVRSFDLPRGLFDRLRKRHPGLAPKDCQLVAHALRQFFLTHLKSGRQPVSMPSQVVDDLWHEFILHTKNYQVFCQHAFGRFMHHTPAVVLGSARKSNAGLRRCFWFACREEHIDPRKPTRLPLLFAIDAKLGVVGGFVYVTDCRDLRSANDGKDGEIAVHCGGDFGSDGFDGGITGFGDASGDATGDGSGGDGGGDGGGGGGCGGD